MSKRCITGLAALLVLVGVACQQRPRDPIGVARTYYLDGAAASNAGLKKRYRLLSADSRKTTSLDEYYQHYGATSKGREMVWMLDSVVLLPADKNLPTYRRIRCVDHSMRDTLHIPGIFYYTLVNENGMWSIVWERALLDQAENLFQKGMLEEAIAVCDRALALNPYSADAYSRKAWCYARQKPRDTETRKTRSVAIEINAKKAIGLEPENPDFYNTLALAYDADDLPELKVECYQKALNLPTCTPRSRVAYYGNIAVQYSYMSKYKKALVYADSALMIDSTCAFALLQKAKSEFLLDRKDSAVADINRALDVNWEEQLDKGLQFTLLYVAALIEEATQNYDESFAHVLKALEIQPSSEGAQELYARVKRRVK